MPDQTARTSEEWPDHFRDLLPVAEWALETETERIRKRQNSTQQEIESFVEIVAPRAGDVLGYLDKQPLDQLSNADLRLLFLMLSLAEVGPAIEFYRSPQVIDGFPPERFLPDEDLKLRAPY